MVIFHLFPYQLLPKLWAYTFVFPHDAGLQALNEKLKERTDKKNCIYWLGWNSWIYFAKHSRIIQQISGKAIGTTSDAIESFVTKKVFKINHLFNCDSKYYDSIDLLFSWKVSGIQCVNSTIDRFRLEQQIGEHIMKTISINIL